MGCSRRGMTGRKEIAKAKRGYSSRISNQERSWRSKQMVNRTYNQISKLKRDQSHTRTNRTRSVVVGKRKWLLFDDSVKQTWGQQGHYMAPPLDMKSSETTEWMVHQKRTKRARCFGKETCLPERVFTRGGPPTPEDWEGGKSLQSGAGAWLPVGVGLLGQGGEATREVGEKGELVHSRAGLGMAVEEFSFRSGKCEGTSGSSASKNAGFNRSMLTVSSMPFIRKVNTFADRLRTS